MTDDHPAAAAAAQPTPRRLKAYRVKRSTVHGNGVFAQRDIAAGDRIIEYKGRQISWEEAQERAALRGGPHNHTFYFSLADGDVIDGGDHGNAARLINHSCDPNCQAIEDEGRIYIYALHDIKAGEELNYSYPLIYEGPPHAGDQARLRLPLRRGQLHGHDAGAQAEETEGAGGGANRNQACQQWFPMEKDMPTKYIDNYEIEFSAEPLEGCSQWGAYIAVVRAVPAIPCTA